MVTLSNDFCDFWNNTCSVVCCCTTIILGSNFDDTYCSSLMLLSSATPMLKEGIFSLRKSTATAAFVTDETAFLVMIEAAFFILFRAAPVMKFWNVVLLAFGAATLRMVSDGFCVILTTVARMMFEADGCDKRATLNGPIDDCLVEATVSDEHEEAMRMRERRIEKEGLHQNSLALLYLQKGMKEDVLPCLALQEYHVCEYVVSMEGYCECDIVIVHMESSTYDFRFEENASQDVKAKRIEGTSCDASTFIMEGTIDLYVIDLGNVLVGEDPPWHGHKAKEEE